MPKQSSSAKTSSKAAGKTPRKPDGEATLSRFQKFEPRRIHRREIKGAPYNPRTIDDFTRSKLKKKLETRGLLSALTWNEKTGNLVSGHQRLAILDMLEGSDNYLLDVDVVKLSPKAEREENVAFNNPSLQGTWDQDALADLLSSEEFDLNLEQTGFELIEVQDMFADTEYESLFTPDAPDEVNESLEAVQSMAPAKKQAQASDGGDEPSDDAGDDDAYEGAPLPADDAAPNGRLANGEAVRDPARHAAVIAEREKLREKMKGLTGKNETEFMVLVICESSEQKNALMVALGKDAAEKYIDARELAHKAKIKLPSAPAS